jgi:hypothetical protein
VSRENKVIHMTKSLRGTTTYATKLSEACNDRQRIHIFFLKKRKKKEIKIQPQRMNKKERERNGKKRCAESEPQAQVMPTI